MQYGNRLNSFEAQKINQKRPIDGQSISSGNECCFAGSLAGQVASVGQMFLLASSPRYPIPQGIWPAGDQDT